MSDSMLSRHRGTNHSDIESLAAFVDGRLEREERDAVTKHLQTCEECQGFVREAAAFQQEEAEAATQKPRRTWWAVAAGVAVAVLASAPFVPGLWQGRELAKDTHALWVAIGNAKERNFEARFGGQHVYARLKPTLRDASEHEKSFDEMLVDDAAAKLASASDNDQSPAGRRARALAEAFDGISKRSLDSKAKDALAILNGIPTEARNTTIWNDIAALNYRLGDFPKALVAVDEALRLDPKMREAMFNRVLILHELRRAHDADKALDSYLAAERDSAWAADAKKKLSEAPLLR